MIELTVKGIPFGEPLDQPLLHPSGVVLLRVGERPSPAMSGPLERAGVSRLVMPSPGEELEAVRFRLAHRQIPLTQLEAGTSLQNSLYDDDRRLLLEAGVPIAAGFADSLRRRGIDHVQVRTATPMEVLELSHRLRQELRDLLDSNKAPTEATFQQAVKHLDAVQCAPAADEDFSVERLRSRIEGITEFSYTIEGSAFALEQRDTRKLAPLSAPEKEMISGTVKECLETAQELLGNFSRTRVGAGRTAAPLKSIDRIVSATLAGVIAHKDLMMLCSVESQAEDYLAAHALTTAVVSTLIGSRMGFGIAQVKSLAYGALLSDVGMTQIPRAIREKPESLDNYELARVKLHTATGLDLLSALRGLPAEVPYIVYQSHERADGSGYPCGKKDVVTHPLARIVGVADLFTAMCSNRPYREAHIPYRAMETLLHLAAKKQFNPEVVRAFLEAHSLFPVGSFVLLNDNRLARVIASNPDAFARPVIAVLSDPYGKALAVPEHLDMEARPDVSVARALPQAAQHLKDRLVGF
jgi:HD-GYP domain-containing protein (c-di-GMP phosphodiesterase class II)